MRQLRRWASAALAMVVLVGGLAPGGAAAQSLPPLPPPAMPGEGEGFSFGNPPGCNWASEFGSNSADQNILDSSTITSTVTITSAGTSLWRLTVTTAITHTYNADISFFLTSPAGTRVSLSTRNGGTLDNVFHGTTWYDKAGVANPPGPVTLATFEDGVAETPLAPEEPFGAFQGEDPNGVWTLEVVDDFPNDQGQLLSWSLSLIALTSTPESVVDGDYNPSTVNIPDDGTPVDLPVLVPQHWASLGELSISTNLVHTESDDLLIELVPPSGDTITLASEQGGLNANVFDGATWLDKAGATNPPGPVTDNVFANNVTESPLAPQEPLSAANGVQPGGAWTLRVSDVDNNVITGTLNGFTLNVTSYICRPQLYVTVRVPDVARMDEPVPVLVNVQNVGAYTTAPVDISATLPISGSFLSAEGLDWTCGGVAVSELGGTLQCSRSNTLDAGETTTVTVLLSPPAAPQLLGVLAASATTLGTADPEATNFAYVFAGAHSANNNYWDVDDNQLWVRDLGGGGIVDGGQAPFDVWGELRLRVFNAGGSLLRATDSLGNFGLAYGPAYHWRTTTPVVTDTIRVARSLYAPPDADWLRYVDTFTNTGGISRTVWVAWGGKLSAGGLGETSATSSGDASLTAADTWAVTIEPDGPAAYTPPVGYAWRSPADTTYQGPGIYDHNPFTDTWPSSGEDHLGHTFKLVLAPGASASLAYFVYRGLSESEVGPADCAFYGDCLPEPAAGSQIALAETTVAALALSPNFCDLTPAEFAKIVNWPGKGVCGLNYLFLPVLQR